MKLFCFFISFVVVNVLGDKLAGYMGKIAIINRQIELVNNRPEVSFETVIIQFVCGNASMEKISIMFAAPGLAILENCEKCENSKTCNISRMELQKYTDYQSELQKAITSVLNEDNSDVKGKSIDDSDNKAKNKLTQHPGFKLLEIMRKRDYEKVSIDEACQNKLLELGNARRILIVKAIENLLFIKASESDGVFSVPNRMCRLRGLYKSVDAPKSYIINARADADRNDCYLIGKGNPNVVFHEKNYVSKNKQHSFSETYSLPSELL